jgi:hypothetical protein
MFDEDTPQEPNDDNPHDRFPGRRKNGQFKKGVSGNPKGPPRKAKSTRAIFQSMLQSKVKMVVDGKAKVLNVIEAMAARAKLEALTGSIRGLERGVAIAEKYSFEDPQHMEEKFDYTAIDDIELDILQLLFMKGNGLPLPDMRGMSISEYVNKKHDVKHRHREGEDVGDDFWILESRA